MKVEVDYDACEANAVCAGLVPEVFEVDDNDDLYILVDEVPERLKSQFDLISGGKDSVTVEQLQKMLSRFRHRDED